MNKKFSWRIAYFSTLITACIMVTVLFIKNHNLTNQLVDCINQGFKEAITNINKG